LILPNSGVVGLYRRETGNGTAGEFGPESGYSPVVGKGEFVFYRE
jgi:hypothetical protein